MIDNPSFTSQAGDLIDERITVDKIEAVAIKTGDFVAVRATYLDDGILALQVRKLFRD